MQQQGHQAYQQPQHSTGVRSTRAPSQPVVFASPPRKSSPSRRALPAQPQAQGPQWAASARWARDRAPVLARSHSTCDCGRPACELKALGAALPVNRGRVSGQRPQAGPPRADKIVKNWKRGGRGGEARGGGQGGGVRKRRNIVCSWSWWVVSWSWWCVLGVVRTPSLLPSGGWSCQSIVSGVGRRTVHCPGSPGHPHVTFFGYDLLYLAGDLG